MTKLSRALCGPVVALLALTCVAKTPTLTGKMVAYNPMQHAAKDASFQANKETVILQVLGKKTRYIKVLFIGFGTSQIDNKFFDGSTDLSVQALRDKTCDELQPNLVREVDVQQRAGTYLLTDAFKSSPPSIRKMECYYAMGKKFQEHPSQEQQ